MSLSFSRSKRQKSLSYPHAMADWSSLPEDLVIRVADCLLADDDLDYYMDFRAVCRHWRQSTVNPKADYTNPRFQPKMWAVLKNYGYLSGSCVVSMVNLRTCRVLCKKIPMLRNYYFFNATDGGLLVIGEGSVPDDYRAWVLNPFTGSKVSFTVPLFSEHVKAVAVTASPMRLFVSDLWTFLGWSDPNTNGFQEYRVRYHSYHASMKLVAGDVYVANRYGSIFSTADEGTRGRCYTEMIKITPTIPAATPWVEDGPSYYLVESAGELLLVSRQTTAEEGHVVEVNKVDTRRKILEPVTNIGRRAIFISKVRSFVVDAFPTIEAGCIYFVDPTMDSLRHEGVVATSFRLADQRQEDIMDWTCWGSHSHPGPLTLVEVLADYCRFIPTFEYEFFNSEDDEFEG